MKTKSIVSKLFLTTTLIAASGFTVHANAASQCKGLENSACDTSASCSWVEGYQRKDGRTVKSFCRAKASAKKASAKKTTVAKATAKKTASKASKN